MKYVKNYITEKFTQESDPINDMGIGTPHIIKRWLDKMQVKNYRINKDMTIDVVECGDNRIDNYNVDLSNKLHGNLPEYINFNHVETKFVCKNNNMTSLRGCPKTLDYYFDCSGNNLTSLDGMLTRASHVYCHSNAVRFTVEDVLKRCKVNRTIFTKNSDYWDWDGSDKKQKR